MSEIRNKNKVDKLLNENFGRIWVDAGCGNVVRGPEDRNLGIDVSKNSAADIICNLGFENIPLPDNSVEKILCYNFLEHIPFVIWFKEGKSIKRELVIVNLFNEFYRILADGGIVEVLIPFSDSGRLNREIFQDITHVSFWTPETVNYLSGDYYGFHDIYGHTSRFKKYTPITFENAFMRFSLIADKHSTGQYVV